MSRHGFTLIEVLVSMAILSFIMVAVWSSTSQSLDAKERFERRDAIYHQGRVAMRKLGNDLAMAFLIRAPGARISLTAEGLPTTTDVAMRPRPITFFVGEDRGERDALRFTSLSNLRLFRNAKESEQVKVAYTVVAVPDEPGVFNLVRTYSPVIDEKDTVEGNSYAVAEGIREFNVEYYDERKQEWVRTWNSTLIDWQDRLPRAARMTISFPDPDDDRQSIVMVSAVMIPLSTGPIEF